MDQIKGAVKHALKAYFGGCFGCLGALSGATALFLVLAVTLGPRALGMFQAIQLPSILSLLSPATMLQGQEMPSMGTPGESAPADCYTTIDAWVSKSELGKPETTFSKTDGMFPVITNPTGCGAVNARLADSAGQTLMEKSFGVVGGGRNGYGDYNPNKNIAPGSYEMQFWYGDILLKKIPLLVQ